MDQAGFCDSFQDLEVDPVGLCDGFEDREVDMDRTCDGVEDPGKIFGQFRGP